LNKIFFFPFGHCHLKYCAVTIKTEITKLREFLFQGRGTKNVMIIIPPDLDSSVATLSSSSIQSLGECQRTKSSMTDPGLAACVIENKNKKKSSIQFSKDEFSMGKFHQSFYNVDRFFFLGLGISMKFDPDDASAESTS